MHEELEELVHAGLTPYEALESGTIHPATFLKRDGDIGTIEAGKIADLVLLDGNPLIDITNTKKILGVMVKGKWFSAEELHGVLEDVKKACPE